MVPVLYVCHGAAQGSACGHPVASHAVTVDGRQRDVALALPSSDLPRQWQKHLCHTFVFFSLHCFLPTLKPFYRLTYIEKYLYFLLVFISSVLPLVFPSLLHAMKNRLHFFTTPYKLTLWSSFWVLSIPDDTALSESQMNFLKFLNCLIFKIKRPSQFSPSCNFSSLFLLDMPPSRPLWHCALHFFLFYFLPVSPSDSFFSTDPFNVIFLVFWVPSRSP